MEVFFSVLKLFPKSIQKKIDYIVKKNDIHPEEIRVRLGQDVVIRSALTEYVCEDTMITSSDINYIIMNATNGSFHSVIHNLQNGFLPLPNGCRLGICGEGTMLENSIHNIQHISSLCIRISQEIIGCSDAFFKDLITPQFRNTIIIGSPGSGKTTLLRELIRKLSDTGYYIGLADERGEVSGINHGKASFHIGTRTDIISGVPKSVAASMILRSMSPDILAMDEITSVKDMPAITEAIGCGVGLLTTMHGKEIKDLRKPSFLSIYEQKVFEYAILIGMNHKIRTYTLKNLYD